MNGKSLSRSDIHREREVLKKRLADLDAAERVLDTLNIGVELPLNEPEIRPKALEPMPSIKHIILRESARTSGATAAEIAAIIGAWKPGYPPTNVSPKLSLYGSQELIRSEGGRWYITDKGKKELDESNN